MALKSCGLYPAGDWSRLASFFPRRFVKFGLIGALGTVVNLAGMALIIHSIGWRDWRASTLSTLLASMNNYSLNNFWTFQDRIRTGTRFVSGYILFLLASLGGLLVTVSVYVSVIRGLNNLLSRSGGMATLPIWALLLSQFFAILCGAAINYKLNKAMTWRI